MPHQTELIALLCIGFVLAFVFGLAAQRLRLSPLVGYLLAGIVAGPFTPGFVADQSLATQLAEIGVILLMFGVGLHFSMRDLLAVRTVALPGAVVQIAVATALGWGLAMALGWSHGAGFVFGLSLSCASTVVLLRALEARRLLETVKGRVAIGWLIVEDLVCVMALVLLPVLAGSLGGEADNGGSSVWSALGLTAARITAFVALMLLVGRRVIPWVLERVAGTGSRELFTLCVLAIAMGLAFVAAELFGVSFALGAFFAGMLLNESEFSHKAARDSLPMRDAFAVLFFVAVGMLFDPLVVVEHPLQVLLTFLIIVFGKSIAAWGIVRLLGKSNQTALVIAASLAQIGEFSFILAGLGLSLQILPELAHSMILAGALLSILCNPLIFGLVGRLQAREDAAAAARAPVPEPHAVPADLAGHAIVVGYGRVGKALAALLHERGMPLVVIEDDADRVAQARALGMLAVRGNAASLAVMTESAPERAALVVFAIPNALEAGEAIARLKQLNPGLTVISRAHSDGEVRHLLEHGADGAVMAERELAISLADMALATPHALQRRADLSPDA